MSSIFVTEFDNVVITDTGVPPFGKINENTKYQAVAFGANSAAFESTTKFIRVVADATCTLSYTPPGGSASTVAFIGSDLRGEYFGVDEGAVISATAAT